MSGYWDDEADEWDARRNAEIEAAHDPEPIDGDAEDDYWEPQGAFL